MIAAALASVFVGAVLGWSFRVLVLLPALAIGAVGIMIVGVIRGDDTWSIAIAIILCATALQLGYLAGAATRLIYPRVIKYLGNGRRLC
jgi:hypothetical protein